MSIFKKHEYVPKHLKSYFDNSGQTGFNNVILNKEPVKEESLNFDFLNKLIDEEIKAKAL